MIVASGGALFWAGYDAGWKAGIKEFSRNLKSACDRENPDEPERNHHRSQPD